VLKKFTHTFGSVGKDVACIIVLRVDLRAKRTELKLSNYAVLCYLLADHNQ
jgi:hypothetical protein